MRLFCKSSFVITRLYTGVVFLAFHPNLKALLRCGHLVSSGVFISPSTHTHSSACAQRFCIGSLARGPDVTLAREDARSSLKLQRKQQRRNEREVCIFCSYCWTRGWVWCVVVLLCFLSSLLFIQAACLSSSLSWFLAYPPLTVCDGSLPFTDTM